MLKSQQINPSQSQFLTFKAQVISIACIFPIGCIYFAKKVRTIQSHPLIFLITLFSILIFLTQFFHGVGKVLVWSAIIVGIKFSWYLAIAISDQNRLKDKSVAFQSLFIQPFWSSGSLAPVPGGLLDLERIEAKETNQFINCQRSGLKLLWWALTVKFFLSLIDFVFFHKSSGIFSKFDFSFLSLFDLNSSNLADFKGRTVPLLPGATGALKTSLIEFYIVFSRLISDFVVSYGKVVAILRMVGFQAFRHTYKPYRANSLADFFARWLYYYNELIKRFFIFPFFIRLRFIKIEKLRVFLSFFLGILCAGTLYHFCWFIPRMPIEGILVRITAYTNALPYFLVLALFASISLVYEKRHDPNKEPFKHVIRILVYSVVYALILTLARFLILQSGWQDLANLFRAMFYIGPDR